MSLPAVVLTSGEFDLTFFRGQFNGLVINDLGMDKLRAAGYARALPVNLHIEQTANQITVTVTEDKTRTVEEALAAARPAVEQATGPICAGHAPSKRATGPKCCDRAGEYNGYSSGPLLFTCPKHCSCHD